MRCRTTDSFVNICIYIVVAALMIEAWKYFNKRPDPKVFHNGATTLGDSLIDFVVTNREPIVDRIGGFCEGHADMLVRSESIVWVNTASNIIHQPSIITNITLESRMYLESSNVGAIYYPTSGPILFEVSDGGKDIMKFHMDGTIEGDPIAGAKAYRKIMREWEKWQFEERSTGARIK